MPVRRFPRPLVAALALGAAVACAEYVTSPDGDGTRRVVRGLSIGIDTLAILDGDTVPVTVVALDQKGVPFATLPPDITVAWTSSDTTVATVSTVANGAAPRVATRGPGRARLTATAANVAGQPSVAIDLLVRRVLARLDAAAGDAQRGVAGRALPAPLAVRVLDRRGVGVPDTVVAFAVVAPTGDSAVVTQRTDSVGRAERAVVLGTRAGAYVVHARVVGAPVSAATFTATAVADRVATLAAARPAPRFATLGRSARLAAAAADAYGNPVDAATLAWRSLLPSVVTVDSSGVVRAVANGSASVVVTPADSAAPADTLVVVVAQMVTTLHLTAPAPSVVAGATMRLVAAAADSGGAPVVAPALVWTSDAPAVATVSDAGVVAGVAPGSARITAAAGDVAASLTLTVTSSGRTPARVAVSPRTATLEVAGDTLQLAARATDADGADVPAGFAWSSSAPAVATVDTTGRVVSGAAPGTALVVATSGALADTATIVVRQVVRRVDVAPTSLDLAVGALGRLVATARDRAGAAIADASVVWTSTAPTVATVGADGTVTGVGVGTATVRATAASVFADVAVAVHAGAVATSCADAGGVDHGAGFVTTAQTWARAESPHRVHGYVQFASGGVLTIEPGALVCFDATAGLVIDAGGTLVADGTADQRIRLLAANGTSWRGVSLRATTVDGAPVDRTIRFVDVDHAGWFTGETFEPAVKVLSGGQWTLEDVRIAAAGTNSLEVYQGRARLLRATLDAGGAGSIGVYVNGGAALVDSGTVIRGEATGISSPSRGSVALRDATITGNGTLANLSVLALPGFDVGRARLATGNQHDVVHVVARRGDVDTADVHLAYAPGLVYQVQGTITMASGTLTIDPGVAVAFDDGSQGAIVVGEGPGGSRLVAEGTAERPIRFGSTAGAPRPGSWGGIRIGPRQTDPARYANWLVEYAGDATAFPWGAALSLGSTGALTFDSVTVRRSGAAGVSVDRAVAVEMIRSRIVRNRVGVQVADAFSITQSTIAGNGLPQDGFAGRAGIVVADSVAGHARASGVWWGDPTGPGGYADGYGDAITRRVDVSQGALTASPFPMLQGERIVVARHWVADTADAGAIVRSPATVAVFDRDMTPATDFSGTWSVTAGGGQLVEPTSATDSRGFIQASWQLGPGGDQRLAFTGDATFSPVVFEMFARPQATLVRVAIVPAGPRLTSFTDSVQLSVRGTMSDGSSVEGLTPTWQSLDAAVADVSSSGLVISHASRGTARIVAALGALADTTTVTVQQVAARLVVRAKGFDPGAPATVAVGETLPLSVTATDSNGYALPPGASYTWTSGNSGVATVQPAGDSALVTGVAVGGTSIAVREAAGATASIDVAVAPPPQPLAFASIAGGWDFSCGLTTDGEAYCWGSNDHGVMGTPGIGGATRPTRVTTALRFTQISARENHVCALTAAGVAYCWGFGAEGRLGTGDANDRDVPAPVAGGLTFKSISAGEGHSCALTLEGKAYCWGYDADGALGDNGGTSKSSPVAVATTLAFASISAGAYHTCAITADSRLYCWGNNVAGQLGSGDFRTRSAPGSAVPGAWSAVFAGGFHTCAIDTRGATYCWGRGTASGINNSGDVPVPGAVVGGHIFTTLAAGHDHTCAVDASGAAYCWGANDGRLGDGTTTLRLTPAAVAMPTGVRVSRVMAGELSSCAVASDGLGWCWGENPFGEVGNGTADPQLVPVKIKAP